MGFVNEKNANEWRTIDYERNIILKDIGGHPNDGKPMRFFEIEIEGQIYKVNAILDRVYDPVTDKSKVNWLVESISAMGARRTEKTKINELVIEAIEAYGLHYEKKVSSSTVIINL